MRRCALGFYQLLETRGGWRGGGRGKRRGGEYVKMAEGSPPGVSWRPFGGPIPFRKRGKEGAVQL